MTPNGHLIPDHEGKSKLVKDLVEKSQECKETCIDEMISTAIINAMVLVQKLEPKPKNVNTFSDVAEMFLNCVDNLVGDAEEVRLVFDPTGPSLLKVKPVNNGRKD